MTISTNFGTFSGTKPQKIEIYLAKPSKVTIAKLDEAYNVSQDIHVGKINELTFTIPYLIDYKNELIRNPNIDILRERYLLKVKLGEKIEWYLINEITDSMDDNGDTKEVKAYSLGRELSNRLLRSYKKTNNVTTILKEILSGTLWTVGYIDSDFDIRHRTFEIDEVNLLDFIFQVAEAFNAMVDFDTVNRKINFLKLDNIGLNKGLKIKYGKYLKSLNRTINPDELVTQLHVYGKDGLSIQRVNPSGSMYLESFEFYLYPFHRDKNKQVISSSYYMSDELCHAILDYQELLESKKGEFANLLLQIESKQSILTVKLNEKTLLDIDLEIIKDKLDIAKSTNQSTIDLDNQLAQKQNEVNTKQSEINSVQAEMDIINKNILSFQSLISIENNFTKELINERSLYIHEGTWQNENITVDKDLYDEAIKQFESIKKPQTVIEIDVVNFLEVIEERRNWNKLSIGDIVIIEYEQFNIHVQAKIIQINYDYTGQSIKLTITDLKEVLSNQEKFIREHYSNISSSKKVDMSNAKWNDTIDKLGEVNDIINGEWEANLKRVVGGVNESITFDRRGLIARNPDFPNDILILQAGSLAISNDNSKTWKTAVNTRGVVAERIFGKLLAGVNLTIENDSGLYTINSDGFTIKNGAIKIEGGLPKDQLDPSFADGLVSQGKLYNGIKIDTSEGFTVTRSDDRVKAIFNATDGLKFQVKEGTQWKDKLYYDVSTSNLVIEGEINARGLKVHGKNVLTTDDKIDGSFISSISTDQLNAGSAKITTAMIETLEVGRNVIFGSNVTMSWGQIYNPPTAEQLGGISANSPRLTYIDAYGLYTGTVTAEKLRGTYIQGIDWMSNSDITPFNVYIGSTSNLAMQIYYDSLNMYRQGTRYFRVDPSGIWHNGQPLSSVATFG